MEFAIVDIETTGTSSNYDRIIEIAILHHDGNKIINKWSTLINPEREIPLFITALTKITDEMVKDAPKFIEVAPIIQKLTQDKIFVAHNAHFDYNFLKAEFARIGLEFSREKICTVRLSRKIIPGYPSYSLGTLCENLNIKVYNRHRAEGDAEATAALLTLLKANAKENFERIVLDFLKISQLPPNLPLEVYTNLPEKPGVYYFLDRHGEPIYIGKSNNIKKRVNQHFSTNSRKTFLLKSQIYNIEFQLTGSDLIAQLLEAEEIKKFKPECNIAQKQISFEYGLYVETDSLGYLCLSIQKIKKRLPPPIRFFVNKKAAYNYLDKIVQKYQLCLHKINSTTITKTPCFRRQLRQCLGACIQEENPESYNQRISQVLRRKTLEGSFMIIEDGRNNTEKAIVLVVNGEYWGYRFISQDEDAVISSLEEAQALIPQKQNSPDIEYILYDYIHKPENLQKIIYFPLCSR
ncbi:MAG: exonuclease domain-containing protein [Bacteroidia bacterium]|nr:exonuclease domain-containing protein [Bacteroidia bacterium]